jgi:hypothetical protein
VFPLMTKSPIAESNTLAYRGNKPDEARRFTNGKSCNILKSA